MCDSPEKRSFLTLRDATRAALEQLAEYGPRRPYLDATCGRYHLSSRGVTGEQLMLLAEQLGVKEGA